MKKILTLPFVLLLTGLACSEGNPIAPTGTILTVTASPNRIGRTGTTTITVTGRKPDGNPIASGTDLFFSTTIGTIDRQLAADGAGLAVATLIGDGRIGTAQVTVSLDGSSGGGGGGGGGGDGGGDGGGGDGGGDGGGGGTPGTVTGTNSVTVSVQIGSMPTLTVNVNPDNIPLLGTAEITVIARNSDGAPVDRERVTLVSNLGSISPSTPRLDANGIARATITAGEQAGPATITAFLANVEGMGTFTIRDSATLLNLEADPSRVGLDQDTTISITASALNVQSLPVSGIGIVFRSRITGTEVGVGRFNPTSQAITDSNGQASVSLDLTEAEVTDNLSLTIFAETGEGSASSFLEIPLE